LAKGAGRRQRGFTLVEVLIVVVILGVLAAIVIPQFSSASAESRLNTMLGNLQTVRSQIQLYKVQHYDLLPGQAVIGGPVAEADFVNDMTTRGLDGYGPYLQKIPVNLYVADAANSQTITCVNDAAATPTGAEGTAWWFNAANGDFRACDSPDRVDY
jgi:general secretion pathway protein G